MSQQASCLCFLLWIFPSSICARFVTHNHAISSNHTSKKLSRFTTNANTTNTMDQDIPDAPAYNSSYSAPQPGNPYGQPVASSYSSPYAAQQPSSQQANLSSYASPKIPQDPFAAPVVGTGTGTGMGSGSGLSGTGSGIAPAHVGIPGFSGSGAGNLLLDDPAALVEYLCGDCQSTQRFSRGVMMRCTECGGRMFYKKRTKRCVFF